MRDFDISRPPTQGERVLGIALTAGLCILFGALAIFLSLRNMPLPSVIFGLLSGAAIVMFYRATFTARRPLNGKHAHGVAWLLLALGMGGFALVLLVSSGSVAQRLMVLSGSIALFSSGIAGVKSRGRDT